MNTKAMDLGSLGFKKDVSARKLPGGVSTILANTIKNVIRNDLDVGAKSSNSNIVLLNKVSEFFRSEMNSLYYEALCMRNISQMPKEDLKAYTSFIQALYTGYKQRYGQEIANLLIVGVTTASKDSQSAKKHFDSLLAGISGIADTYNAAAVKESTKIQDLSLELHKKESSVITRIFKKGEIRRIKVRIDRKKSRIAKIESKKGKYIGLANSLKTIVAPAPAKA